MSNKFWVFSNFSSTSTVQLQHSTVKNSWFESCHNLLNEVISLGIRILHFLCYLANLVFVLILKKYINKTVLTVKSYCNLFEKKPFFPLFKGFYIGQPSWFRNWWSGRRHVVVLWLLFGQILAIWKKGMFNILPQTYQGH